MTPQISPATAMPNGSPRQCAGCPEDIAIGSPCAPNAFGVPCHPGCADLTPAQVRARTHVGDKLYGPHSRVTIPAPVATAIGDDGDLVADALDRLFGRAPASATPAALGVAPAAAVRDKGDDVADALDRMLGRTGGQQ